MRTVAPTSARLSGSRLADLCWHGLTEAWDRSRTRMRRDARVAALAVVVRAEGAT